MFNYSDNEFNGKENTMKSKSRMPGSQMFGEFLPGG
jgi:hypothetical protein